ncbi:MAG: glycosyltransferase [Ignavibacterium sp.]|nr:glycosyltransferase [Ignavibacterium sp.]
MAETILIILFALLLIHYLAFLSVIYYGLNNLRTSHSSEYPEEFVSIIVPFRNETESILHCYESLTEQDFPKDKYEIIFVNDFSTDDSLEKLNANNTFENVKVFSVPDSYSINAHKKRAIRYGIENSVGDIIVTTDADCVHSTKWLKSLLSFFDNDTGFISGPVEFLDDNSVFNRIQKSEFAGLVITGAGLIGAEKPTICNAANIAYRKKVYEEVGGFTYQMNLSSGDDELLMQKIHKDSKFKVRFALNRNAIVKTTANKNLTEFYQQRKRWASKGLFYNNKMLVVKLILIYLFYLSIPIQLILGLFFSNVFLFATLISFVAKLLAEFLTLKKGVNLLFEPALLRSFFWAELFQIPYIILAGVSGLFGNYKWKNRKVYR